MLPLRVPLPMLISSCLRGGLITSEDRPPQLCLCLYIHRDDTFGVVRCTCGQSAQKSP